MELVLTALNMFDHGWLFYAFFFKLQWSEIRLQFGSGGSEPVLQACRNSGWRSVLSKWMERREAHHLLIDISVAQEGESSGELSPLKVHLFDTDDAFSKFPKGPSVLDLQNSKLFSSSDGLDSISSHLNRSVSLSLGPVSRKGFQLGFSYTGECVFIASIRVYYKACPDLVSNLTLFPRTGAGAEPVWGRCVAGAVQSAPPVRECGLDGAWSSQQGGCSCGPGLEERGHTCEGRKHICTADTRRVMTCALVQNILRSHMIAISSLCKIKPSE